jgi:phosphatidylglycerol---prolipoprotein diacylglyceryl transferase
MFPYITDLVNYILGTTIFLPVYTYGFMLVVAAFVAFSVVCLELKRRGDKGRIPAGSEKPILTIALVLILSTFAGSKIFHILDHSDQFLHDPLGTLGSFNGLSFYGGLVFGIAAVILYARHHHIPYPDALDMTALAALIGQAIGRLGCHLSGDGCWGIVHVNPKPEWLWFLPGWAWGFRYPHNVLNAGLPIPGCGGTHCCILPWPVFPTSFYESCLALVFFIILWSVRKKITTPGWLFSIFIICYSTSRFFIEFIRVNPKISFAGINLSQSQYISVICFILGITSTWYFRWSDRGNGCNAKSK